MHKLFFLIGASGAGKTTAAKTLAQQKKSIAFYYFDSIGVPSAEDMIRNYGSGEEWQRIKTLEWVKTIKQKSLAVMPAVLDAQTRPSFIQEACSKNRINDFGIILFDCSDEVRKQRLLIREQPELANEQMLNWAKYLREQCTGHTILDNSHLSKEETVRELDRLISESL